VRKRSGIKEIIESGKFPGVRVDIFDGRQGRRPGKPTASGFLDDFTFKEPFLAHSRRQWVDHAKRHGIVPVDVADFAGKS